MSWTGDKLRIQSRELTVQGTTSIQGQVSISGDVNTTGDVSAKDVVVAGNLLSGGLTLDVEYDVLTGTLNDEAWTFTYFKFGPMVTFALNNLKLIQTQNDGIDSPVILPAEIRPLEPVALAWKYRDMRAGNGDRETLAVLLENGKVRSQTHKASDGTASNIEVIVSGSGSYLL